MGAKRSCPLIVCPKSTPIPNFRAVLVVFVPSPPERKTRPRKLFEGKNALVTGFVDVDRARKIPISVADAGLVWLKIRTYAGMSSERGTPPMGMLVGRVRMLDEMVILLARLVEKKARKLLVRRSTIPLWLVWPRISATTSKALVELVKVPSCKERLVVSTSPEEERGSRLVSRLIWNLPSV